ncbi:hypothetical protein [Piscinibacter sp. XHJ-5]|uniref:hypothetical protein n=1 Tax=Piscinibacter sp. XHJ-5 TaxID=3037797 RepID=UPI0024528B5F|nr:hypothetical protein [Piscinibacter sp. XHJ-5]
MFFAIVWLQPLIRGLEPVLAAASGVAGAVASLGVYRLLSSAFLWLFGNSLVLRRLILGKSFLEGTWIGHYMHEEEHRFTIEFVDQASGTTVIHGREFDSAGKTRASWASDTVSIDIERMHLVYAYTCKVFVRKHVQEGLGVFTLVRESSEKAPTKLDGYAVDLIDGDRDPNTEYKICDEPLPDEESLAEARKRFNVTE